MSLPTPNQRMKTKKIFSKLRGQVRVNPWTSRSPGQQLKRPKVASNLALIPIPMRLKQKWFLTLIAPSVKMTEFISTQFTKGHHIAVSFSIILAFFCHVFFFFLLLFCRSDELSFFVLPKRNEFLLFPIIDTIPPENHTKNHHIARETWHKLKPILGWQILWISIELKKKSH